MNLLDSDNALKRYGELSEQRSILRDKLNQLTESILQAQKEASNVSGDLRIVESEMAGILHDLLSGLAEDEQPVKFPLILPESMEELSAIRGSAITEVAQEEIDDQSGDGLSDT